MQGEQEFYFRDLFTPFTNLKAVLWIVAIGFIVYFNMLFNGFVWDDKPYILNNLEEHALNMASFFGSSLFNSGGQYRPIPALYFALLFSLFRDFSFFYHFIQLGIHIINASLIFLLFSRFVNKKIRMN